MTDHERIAELAAQIKAIEDKIDQMETESKEREIKRLKWGISALGTVVLVLGSWAWTQVSHLVTLKVGQ